MTVRTHALALLAAGGLVAAALAPTVGAGAADDSARPAPPAYERAAKGWKKVSSGAVDSLSEISVVRTSDGVLHAVYQQDVGVQDEYEHVTVSTSGAVTSRSKPLGTWNGLVHNPKLLRSTTGGLRLVFSGGQDTVTANFYSHGYAYDTIGDVTGTSWALQPRALTKFGYAYSGYGIGATTLSNGTPVTAASLNSETHYRVGTIDTTDQLAVTAAPDDGLWNVGLGNYFWGTTLVNSGDNVWAVAYVDGNTEATRGIFVQQVYPTAGPMLKAPGSTTNGSSLNPDQTVAAVARPGGGVVVAYKTGYPTANAISVWQVGGAVKKVKVKDVRQIALDTGATGRLWLAWVDGLDQVHAARSAPTGLGFGAAQDLGSPSRSGDLWRIAVDGSLDQGTVFVNDVVAEAVSLRIVKPGLSLSASGNLKAGRRGTVKAKVTDAGAGLKGVKVKGGGDSCTTKANGTCTLTVTPRKSGRLAFIASEKGYGDGKDVVKVKN